MFSIDSKDIFDSKQMI